MLEIAPLKLNSLERNSRRFSQATPYDRIAALAVLAFGIFSLMFWWPRFSDYSRFALICCFPAVFPFCHSLVRSLPGLHKHAARKVLSIMIAIHCALLVSAVFLWMAFPSSVSIRNPDLVFAFMAVEVAAMNLLVRFSGQKMPKGGR